MPCSFTQSKRVHETNFAGGTTSLRSLKQAMASPRIRAIEVKGLKWRMGREDGKREDIFQASTCGMCAEGMRAEGEAGLPSSTPFL